MAKRALLLGVNQYQSVSDLRGCVSDVEKFQSLLTEVFDFPAAGIHTLTDGDVVKTKIAEEWKWLLKGARPGDALVFMFAGHGSMTTDLDEDEPDGVDELLCLHDMDFDDPSSYLLDDEIQQFTRKLPRGVSLTILFDSCHSGTATRMLLAPTAARSISRAKAPLVDLATTAARSGEVDGARSLSLRETGPAAIPRILMPETPEENRQVVLVRFIEPPPKVLDAMYARGTRSGFQKRRGGKRGSGRRQMNHVFYAGCESGQTSADAYIDSGFHGAFSYHFCRAVRAAGASADQQAILREVRGELSRGRFSQIPQLEPESSKGPLFGGAATTSSPKDKPARPVPAGEPVLTPPTAGSSDANQQILSLLGQILAELKSRPAVPGARQPGQRALVYIHGICRHDAGYSDPWWQALKPHLAAPLGTHLESHRSEVLWSQHVTAMRSLAREGLPASAARELDEREQALAQDLQDAIADREARAQLAEMPPADRSGVVQPMPLVVDRSAVRARGVNCIDDFAKYLLWKSVRRAVQKEFLDVVLPLLEAGNSVDVIGHSWGTVVAYEALRTLDRRQLPGEVLNFFTAGSALSIGLVYRRLETQDGAKPAHVRRWVNLDASRDLVGGPLRPMGYQVDEEYLNLEPTGCRLILDGPWCPHSSYFQAANVGVNRDVFAARMQG
jgi:hypothetical protein